MSPTRREFVKTASALTSLSLIPALTPAAFAADSATTAPPWYKSSWRRAVIDMHITDHDAMYLSKFDPDEFVRMLELAHVRSAIVYAHSHVGLAYFPTQVGKTHAAFVGKDHLQRVVDGCHSKGIAPILYYSLIYNTWAYREFPDFRMRNQKGEGVADTSRYGVCCPNSSYRDHVLAQVREMAEQFDVEGFRFDMTFWPTVCYCAACARRFDAEVGGAIPTRIDWFDKNWVAFQRRREAWLSEFAGAVTGVVREVRPNATVEHQASVYTQDWHFGVATSLIPHNDFLQGDFYGGPLQGSFARKLFSNISPNLPYGFETSIMLTLANFTSLKSTDLLRAKAFASISDGGAFVFIDSIDPVGTLNERVYRTMGEIFHETERYEPFLGGRRVEDVAIYLSTESKCDFEKNGRGVDEGGWESMPHVDAALGAADAFRRHHIPFGVIARPNLADLSRHRVVVLPNVLMMDEEERNAIHEYVKAGGCVYASKLTSLTDSSGERSDNFSLADLFGVDLKGNSKEWYTYITPEGPGLEAFAPYSAERPLGMHAHQHLLEAHDGAVVLGRLTLPLADPADPNQFSSIHNNPPGPATDHPSVVLNSFGKGRVIYSAYDLERDEAGRDAFVGLIRLLAGEFSFEAEAPAPVELVLFHQPDQNRYILNAINFQEELPNIPVDGIVVTLRMTSGAASSVHLLPDGTSLAFEKTDSGIRFTLPRIETFQMIAVNYA